MGILGLTWQIDNVFSFFKKETPKYLKLGNIHKFAIITLNTLVLGAI